jgi:hypothetical protein
LRLWCAETKSDAGDVPYSHQSDDESIDAGEEAFKCVWQKQMHMWICTKEWFHAWFFCVCDMQEPSLMQETFYIRIRAMVNQ